MNTPRFTFTDEEYQRMLAALGRSDAPATRYLDELEWLAQGYQAMQAMGGKPEIPEPIRSHLERLSEAARMLAQELYELPDETRSLLALHLISGDTSRRLTRDFFALQEPLSDLAEALARVCRGESDAAFPVGEDPDRVLLRALARAYRNHFNIRVGKDRPRDFDASLRCLLEIMEQHRIDGSSALLAQLDQRLVEASEAPG